MVSTRSLDLRSVTSILVDEDSLDLCAHCRDRQYCKGQASQAGPFLCLVDPPIEEVCWFLLEGLLGQVCLIFVGLVIVKVTVGMDLVEVVAYRYGSCGRGRTGARLAGRSRGSEGT